MPVTLITSVPAFISPEEHTERTAATPASFSDIPPVLQHKEVNARITFDPPVPDLTEHDLRKGTVYVLETVLAFISSSSGRGFQIDYPSIILHAISRSDPPSIYCQLGESASASASEAQDAAVVGGADGDEEEEATDLREMNIYPESASSLNEFFEALSQCASLHPDELSSSDGDLDMDGPTAIDDDDDDAIVDADVEAIQAIAAEGVDGESELSETGRAMLDRLEPLIQDPYNLAGQGQGSGSGSVKVNGFHERGRGRATAASTAVAASSETDQFADAPEQQEQQEPRNLS